MGFFSDMTCSLYILHPDAAQAAEQLCDKDVEVALKFCLQRLRWAHKKKQPESDILLEWVLEDGLNYYWLAYFCDCLNRRTFLGQEVHTEIKSLRISNPAHQRCRRQTEFPLYVKRKYKHQPVIEAYRAAYLEGRNITQWSGRRPPGWFLRLADTVSARGESQPDLLSQLAPRPLRATNRRGRRSARTTVRNGEIFTIDGKPTGFALYPLELPPSSP